MARDFRFARDFDPIGNFREGLALGRNIRDTRETRRALRDLRDVELDSTGRPVRTDAQLREEAGVGEDFMGPPPPTQDTGYDAISAAVDRANNILNPEMKARYQEALAAKLSTVAVPYANAAIQGMQTGNPEQAAAAMNAMGRIAGGDTPFQYEVNEDGKVVSKDGTELTEAHVMAGVQLLKQNPEQALDTLFKGRETTRKAGLEERAQTDAEARTRSLEERNRIMQEHYERADAVKLVGEINDFRAAAGLPALKPADVDRYRKAVDTAIDNDMMASSLASIDSAGYRGLTKSIALVNYGDIQPDDALHLASDLFIEMNRDRLPDDVLDMAAESARGQRTIQLQEAMNEDGSSTGLVQITFSTGETILTPDIYVGSYMRGQQAKERAAQEARARNMKPPLPPRQQPSAGAVRREQRGRGGVDFLDWTGGAVDDRRARAQRSRQQ